MRYLIANADEFKNTYEKLENDDIIEFEDGTNIDLGGEVFVIDKSISMLGKTLHNKISTEISGSILVTDGVGLNIKDMIINGNRNDLSTIAVRKNSCVELTNVFIKKENRAKISDENEVQPEICIAENSKLIFNRVTIPDTKDFESTIYIFGSTADFNFSYINSSICAEQSVVKISNSRLTKYFASPIYAVNSNFEIINTFSEGGALNKTGNLPNAYFESSVLNAVKSDFVLRNSENSLHLAKSSTANLEHCTAPSITCDYSTMRMNRMVIEESMDIKNKSFAASEGTIDILCKVQDKIYLTVEGNSILKIDTLNFENKENPKIIVKDNSELNVIGVKDNSF